MSSFAEGFQKEKEEQLKFWQEMVLKVFGENPSEPIKITDRDQIIEVLDIIGGDEALNYTFFPSGGGLDLLSAVPSKESGLVEMRFVGGSTKIVNPDYLVFHQVGFNPEWWYFRLITKPFKASGVYAETSSKEGMFLSEIEKQVARSMRYAPEEVLEIRDGEYVERAIWDRGHMGYDSDGYQIPIPVGARIVCRQHKGGDYIIFSKFSRFNQVATSDDGSHNEVSDEVFRSFIDSIVKKLSEEK